MATTYHWHKQAYAIPYDAFGMVVLKKHFDVPAIIASGAAGYSPLAVADVRTALPSAGFANGDSINMFRVPLGFLVLFGGVRVTTAGTASCTMDVGFLSATQTAEGVRGSLADDDHWMAAVAVSTTGNYIFNPAGEQTWNVAATFYDLYVTDGSIDVLFETATQAALIADFWVIGCKAF